MSTTYPCVSPAIDGIRDDQRVNYAFGMVLGVEEMVQEQRHRLVADAAGYALLAGSGTIDGLAVTAAGLDGEAAGEVQITVAAGTGVDRLGRRFVVPEAQCARLGAWVAAQERARPGTIADLPRDDDGTTRVYVVAQYASCLDALVPLPGQPCSSSDATAVPSRITDAWDIDLRWHPPGNPRWDADRALATLLAAVRVVPDLEDDALREAELVAAMDEIGANPGLPPPDTTPSGDPFRLRVDTLTQSLDRLLIHWVTAVRPALLPNLERSGPDVDAAVLLAEIAFDPGEGFDPDNPRIASYRAPDNGGRPYLLHGQLLQRLHDLHAHEAISPVVPALPLSPVTVAFRRAEPAGEGGPGRARGGYLEAWWHLGAAVSLREEVTVTDQSGGQTGYRPSARDDAGAPTDLARVWRLDPPLGTRFVDGQQLRVSFPGSVPVGPDGMTLADTAGVLNRAFVGATDDGGVEAVAVVDLDEAAPAPPPEPGPAHEFVTITPESDPREVTQVELWFHLTPRGEVDQAVATKPALEVFDESRGNRLGIDSLDQDGRYPNLWHLRLERTDDDLPASYLRLVFRAAEFGVDPGGGQVALADWIEEVAANFIGWDRDARDIVTYARVPKQAQR